MARRSAIIAATKAMPGAARPTPAPQGGTYYGALSPLVQQLNNERGYANSNGPFLPRPERTFTEGAFGPFSPILPVPVDAPPEGADQPDPRLYEYQVGWNLPVGQPGTEGLKLADFSTLRTLANLYSVARTCIQIRKSEIRGLDWDIVPTHEAAKAYQNDHDAMRDFGERRAKAVKFFRHPDPDFFNFGSWLDTLLDEVFVYDALSLVLRPKWGKGLGRGLLGSDLDCIELISGPTIRPLVGMHGEIPRPPCYSEDTEILTRDGWTLFSELKGTEEVATRSKDGVFEWQQPTHYVNVAYTGPMVQFHGRSIDCLVTPDHRMLTTVGPDDWAWKRRVRDEDGHFCRTTDGKNGVQREWITSAQRLLERKQAGNKAGIRTKRDDRLVATSVWHGRELTQVTFSSAGQIFTWDEPHDDVHMTSGPDVPVDVRDNPMTMTGDQFAAFMGMYLSEGGLVYNAAKYDYKFTISQTAQGKGLTEYGELIKDLFGIPHAGRAGWTIYRKVMWRYLHQFGCAKEKFAPPEVLELSKRQLEIFLEHYWLGDGHYAYGQKIIATSSQRMAGNLQEVIQKLGYSASAVFRKDGCCRLGIRKTAYPEYNAHEAEYSGRVYCVTVPNGVVYVRRNGHSVWSGNSPAYQQFLYGVPRSDYMTLMTQRDIEEGGLSDAEVASFRKDQLLYLPMLRQRWTPYGMPPIERALIPVMSGLQKQGFQLDYFREGTVPAVYISPGDPNITPNQVRELQDALNAIAGDPAWHHKIIVLPPGSKVEPQRPVDLSDQFDEMVITQVCMAFDVNPIELGILPNVSSTASPFAAKEMAQASRNIHERVSTKPTLKFLCAIFDDILHRVCGQDDMKFTFEGLQEEADQAAVTDLLVKQVQYGIRSVDEARGEIELPPWGEQETSEPVVFTQMGPVPFKMALPLMEAQMQGSAGQGQQQGSNKPTSTTGRGDQYGGPGRPRHNTPIPAPSTKPSGGELPPERHGTGAHAAARAHTAQPSVKPGGGSPRGNARAAKAEMEALARHLKKGREFATWESRNIPASVMAVIEDDLTKGLSIDEVMDVASRLIVADEVYELVTKGADAGPKAHIREWPGWKRDLGLIGAYVEIIRKAFSDAEGHAGQLREEWAKGRLAITESQYKDLVGDAVERVIESALIPLWKEAWELGYTSAEELVTGAHEARSDDGRDAFIVTQGKHWAQHIGRTGIKNAIARSEMIARTEIARAQSAAAIECYRKYGVSYKHLVVAPDDVCEKCHKDEAAGLIPLDAAFPSGNVGTPIHVQCRCMPAPAGVNVIPPQGHIGKSAGIEDPGRVAFLLIRARNSDGKWRYLLQKRGEDVKNPGEWGLPGGTCHVDEHPWLGALREAEEEMGELPAGITPQFTMTDVRDDHTVYTYIVELPAIFHPSVDGDTAHEVGGWGWFKRKEVTELNLQDAFRRTWDDIQWDTIGKKARRQIDLNGQETIVLDDDAEDDEDRWAAGGGSPVPRPHDADGTQVAEPPPGSKPGSEPPRWGGAGVPPIIPANDDSRMPYQRGRPPNAVGKGAADVWDPNPVEPEHIMSIMRENFPEDALGWVRRAHWIGPVNVPWERINSANMDSWASAHQSDAVDRFAEGIKSGTAHLNPSILVQRPDDDKCDIIDGHHRALARNKLGKPVLAYIGFVHKGDMQAALETHSSQFHSGSDPQNKSAETPRVSTEHHPLGREGLWHTPSKKVPEVQQLPAYIQNIARALMRDQGMEESRAIATAVNAVKRWARGDLGWGKHKITPEVQAAAQRALAEWEHLRATHH